MRRNDPNHGPPRRCFRPGFEGLEARDLPSASPLSTDSVSPQARLQAAVDRAAADPAGSRASHNTGDPPYNTSFNGLIGKGRLQPFLDPNIIQQAVNAVYGPATIPDPNHPGATIPNPNYPSQAEIKREEFTASASGRYLVGPPTFSDRSERIYAYGTNSLSSGWLKSKWQVVMHPPANPAATPNPGDPFANQVVGLAIFMTQNFPSSGSGLILDLNENVDPNSDPHALPTHGTWTLDLTSAAAFTTPLYFTEGAGTWTAQYVPDKHPKPGSMGSGTVVFRFQGIYNFSQLISSLSKAYS